MTDDRDQVEQWQRETRGLDALGVVDWAQETFGDQVALSSSLGAEDQVLTDMLVRRAAGMCVFTLDTGRLPPETLTLLTATQQRYGLSIRVYQPDPVRLREMLAAHGADQHRVSLELRRLCCQVRKLEPLARALEGRRAWICGLRREQTQTRAETTVVAWDSAHGMVKINPLADWTAAEVWQYIRDHDVPYNSLHDQGYPSIGCACCTRAVAAGEDIRSGRWWWESPEHKECGLHLDHGAVTRSTVARMRPAVSS